MPPDPNYDRAAAFSFLKRWELLGENLATDPDGAKSQQYDTNLILTQGYAAYVQWLLTEVAKKGQPT